MIITFLALGHLVFCRFFVVDSGPLTDALQNGDDRFSFFSKGIFHSWRNLVILLPFYNPVPDQFFQGGGQNGICNVAHFSANHTVSEKFFICQNTDDTGFPFSSEDIQAVFQRTADVLFQLSLIHRGTSCVASIIMSDPQEDKSLCNL